MRTVTLPENIAKWNDGRAIVTIEEGQKYIFELSIGDFFRTKILGASGDFKLIGFEDDPIYQGGKEQQQVSEIGYRTGTIIAEDIKGERHFFCLIQQLSVALRKVTPIDVMENEIQWG